MSAELNMNFLPTETYIVGTQKNRLNETVILGTLKRMFKSMGKKLYTIKFYAKNCLSEPM